VPKGQAVPGVHLLDSKPWPIRSGSNQQPASSSNNGRVYIEYRRDLEARYAARWMCSLHDHDPSVYAMTLFQLSADLTEENTTDLMVLRDSQVQTVGCFDYVGR
jgi:hypothetical protein